MNDFKTHRNYQNEITVDLGGYGDCGYRAIIAAFIAAHINRQLSQEQYEAAELTKFLNTFYAKAKRYLAADFQQQSNQARLDTLVHLCGNPTTRKTTVIDLAEALRQTSVATLYTNLTFAGFVVTDKSTLPKQDQDLVLEHGVKKHTYISGAEIAAAAAVLHVPVQVISQELEKAEIYNSSDSISPLKIELAHAHYTARVSTQAAAVFTAVKLTPIATTEVKSATVETFAVSAKNYQDLMQATPLQSNSAAETFAISEPDYKKLVHATENMEQTYRDQREKLEFLLLELSLSQLKEIYDQYKTSDDYLSGQHGLDIHNNADAMHLIATAAWKNPEIARMAYKTLVKAELTAEAKEFAKQLNISPLETSHNTKPTTCAAEASLGTLSYKPPRLKLG